MSRAVKFRLGLFEQPYVDAGAATGAYGSDHAVAVARTAAAESVVVLTNDGVLPLVADGTTTIAVIGPGADDQRLLQGDYHYPAHVEILYAGGLTNPAGRNAATAWIRPGRLVPARSRRGLRARRRTTRRT